MHRDRLIRMLCGGVGTLAALLWTGSPLAAQTVPEAPTSLTSSVSGSSVTLQWAAPASGALPTAYTIEVGSLSGLADLEHFSTGTVSTSFSASGVGVGVYYVRVRATNSAGTGAASSEIVVTVCAAAPGAPGGLRTVAVGVGTVVLSWTAAIGFPSTYVVEAGSALGLSNLANADLGSTATTVTATDVARGTYYVRVRARNACGTGAVSNEITVVVLFTTLTVRTGGNLQNALDQAQPGDTILLEAGATFTGNFTLPVKGGADYITVRSSAPDASLPGAGARMTPAYAALLPKIRSPSASRALGTAAGAHHWKLLFLEFPASVDGTFDIVTLGDGSSAQSSLGTVAHDLVVDRVYVHGEPSVGVKRGIALNSASTSILNSSIVEIHAVGQDSQAIAGWNGPGPFTIVNNRLEAAGENFMLGGADPSIQNLVPSDVVFRHNYLTKPTAWRGSSWSVKNLFELKNARRVLVEGNVFDGNWAAAQAGYAILFTPRNQDGRAPWSGVQDVTFRYNVIRHVAGGVNILGYDNLAPSAQTARVMMVHNFWSDVSTAWGGSGHFALVGDGATDITFDHNTIDHTGNAISAYGRPTERFIFRNNLLKHNTYGIIGDNRGVGNDSIGFYLPGSTVTSNTLAGGSAAAYPAGNLFPSVASWQGQFVDVSAGNYRLAGSSLYLTAATDGGSLGADMATVLAAGALAESGGPPAPAPSPSP